MADWLFEWIQDFNWRCTSLALSPWRKQSEQTQALIHVYGCGTLMLEVVCRKPIKGQYVLKLCIKLAQICQIQGIFFSLKVEMTIFFLTWMINFNHPKLVKVDEYPEGLEPLQATFSYTIWHCIQVSCPYISQQTTTWSILKKQIINHIPSMINRLLPRVLTLTHSIVEPLGATPLTIDILILRNN